MDRSTLIMGLLFRGSPYIGPSRAPFRQSAMTQVLISFADSVANISSPASIMLFGSVLVALAIGLRRANGPS